MRFRNASICCLLVLSAALPALAGPGSSQERFFSASYAASNAVDLGDQIRIDFSMRLRNHSGGDVVGATVSLREEFMGLNALHSWESQVLFEDSVTVLSWTVTVEKHEYDRWLEGASPRVDVLWVDPSGATRLSVVEIFKGLFAGE